ncbi:MAG: hypothetical protein JZD41_01750 [Thermoproteus sp.]|nr:hypothetical protein [Thermoproteus sp.]
MGDQNFSIWVATIKGRRYVYLRYGDRKSRYLGPLEVVNTLVKKLADTHRIASEKPTQKAAAAQGTDLEEFAEELKAKISPKSIDAMTVARAITLEILNYNYSEIMEEIWDALAEYVRCNERGARALAETIRQKLRELTGSIEK